MCRVLKVLHRLKSTAPNVKVELYLNTDPIDPIDPVDDKKIIAQMPLRDKMIMSGQAKYTQFLLQLADLGCSLQLSQLRHHAS
ncbi:hypothetical protein Pmani_027960 [Petrolisthes manimaculis]|uniref:UBP24/USP9X/USP9Y ubiquitin-like domain-containing protein n=1 Tax=Petrolisthes manimaculis TaxID=1843537 RepID=A0AAE1P1N2_9EUCA|nr:hypothetical protein Pmani_027960 [Petrolisthes manimaculis]